MKEEQPDENENESKKHDIKPTPLDDYGQLAWPSPAKDGVVISSERGVVRTKENETRKDKKRGKKSD